MSGARFAAALLLATTLTACSAQRVALTPTILLPPSSVGAGASIALSPVVEGIPEPIGRPTTSLLHIPSGRVDLDRGAESIVDGMRRSLEASGYRVTRPGENATDPVLVGRVERMRFRSNDWAAPIVFIGGEIELSLSLVDSSGATRWEQTYHRSYKDDGVRISFEDALNETFDKVLAGAMQDFGSDAFREACCTARPQAPRSSATDFE